MKNKTVLQWTQELASKDGKYTGGSAASMVAAVSVSLAQFIFELQLGKERYQEEEILESIEKARRLNIAFLDLSERDADAFGPVLDLYKLPKGTVEEKKIRAEKIDRGLVNAAQPPLEMIIKLNEVADLFQLLIDLELKGTIVGDITVGLDMGIAAVEGAKINTMANVKSIHNKKIRTEMTEKVNEHYRGTLNKFKELKELSVH